MDAYAGRVLADRYRLPRPPADAYELAETRAFDTYSGQEVLLRQVLLPEVVGADESGSVPGSGGPGSSASDSARRALEAARTAAGVPDHPRLVQVFDIFVEDGSLWIAGELVAGRPLAALLADKPLSAYRAAEVANDVLTALRVLHAQGWTHRNVTAGTVLVCDDGRAMLSGLAAGAAQEALCGYDPLPAEVLAARVPAGAAGGGAADGAGGGSGGDLGSGRGWGGPHSVLELERARQARITVVGAVTERWAPEQATPLHENWRLAPPVGPAADLWALGALLFRSVQGHPPFPEESAAELVQLVCAERPAFAEDTGPLRPVVESLLRPDPEERTGAEELSGWLRSLIRSAPEPDLGVRTVPMPADPQKLPIVRRRGELVRRRRGRPGAAAASGTGSDSLPGIAAHRRHARPSSAVGRPGKSPRTPSGRTAVGPPVPDAYQPGPQGTGSPRRLGARLLIGVLLLLVAALVYAMTAMPGRNTGAGPAGGAERTVPAQVPGSGSDDGKGGPGPTSAAPTTTSPSATDSPGTTPSAGAPPGTDLGGDFALRKDAAGFSVAVHTGWQRVGRNAQGQIRYTEGDFQLIVVPGRDSVADHGDDPLGYQLDEPELAAFRASDWASAGGLRSLDLAGAPAAEGEYSWRDPSGRQVYARNVAVIRGGAYHVVLVIGPDSRRSEVKRLFEKAAETYRPAT